MILITLKCLAIIMIPCGALYCIATFIYEFCRSYNKLSNHGLYIFNRINGLILTIGIGSAITFCLLSIIWMFSIFIWIGDEILI